MPIIDPTYKNIVKLNAHYKNQTFGYNTLLPSQKLMDFQSGLQGALSRLAMAQSRMGDWGIVGSITSYIDALFFEDYTGSSPDTSTYYSFGDSVRVTTQTPDPPKYYTIVDGDSIFFGHRQPYVDLIFDFSANAPGTINPTWRYWNGAWTAFTNLVDGTVGFTGDGSVTWNEPYDWLIKDLDTILGLTRFSIDTEERFWSKVTLGTTRVFTVQQLSRSIYDKELKVRSTDPASKSVLIYPGFAYINGRVIRVKGIQTLDLTSYVDVGNNRNIIVQLNEEGIISGKVESSAGTPDEDEPDFNAMKLAKIYLAAGDTTINGGGDGFGGDITNCEQYLPLAT